MTHIAHLADRGVIEVTGEDRVAFLQGLVSNDVALAVPGTAVWAALLTPQGKWLADFFILSDGNRLLLDVERAQVALLVPRLTRFRLRAKVAIADVSDAWTVHVAWNGPAPAIPGLIAPDPRLPGAGWRILSQATLPANATPADWNAHRLSLGLPDGSADLEAEKSILLEAGFDELNGVSWSKGCYMGQELTARTKYRGLVKRRLVPVITDGPLPSPGTPVLKAGLEVGTLRSAQGPRGLASLRLDALAGPLTCDGMALSAEIPAWMRLPVTA